MATGRPLIWRFAACALAALAAACAAPADVRQMTAGAPAAADGPLDPALRNAVCVELVDGGKKTNPLWVSEVDNRSFLDALEASLANHGLLAPNDESCRFGVEAHLLGLSQPYISIDVEVTANVNYRVRRPGAADLYLIRTERAAYIERFTADKPLWATRLKAANEGAVRKNIRSFIGALLARAPEA